MSNPLLFRGKRNGVLIIGDSLPPARTTLGNIKTVLDPTHPVYNSLIVPIKFYLNNYLNSIGYCLPLEEYETDYFYYINAIQDPETKSKPDLSELEKEINRPEHKVILSMGSFVFKSVEQILKPGLKMQKSYSIKDLGKIFSERIEGNSFPIHLPILHNVANLKFEKTKDFISDYNRNHISYFQYVGVRLGELLIKNKQEFNFLNT